MEVASIDKLTTEAGNEDWFHSILKAESPPSARTTRIQRVHMILKEDMEQYNKYYVPKVVSLGPYHHGKPELEPVEGFKPLYTNRLLKRNQETIRSLYVSLAKMVQTLKGYYEDDVDHLSDDEFIRMMLLDACFILYFIGCIFLNNETDSLRLRSHQIVFVLQDMFLLENQIPYQVLTEVMKLVPDDTWDFKIKLFIDDNILAVARRTIGSRDSKLRENDPIPTTTNHLLELLQTRLTKVRSFGPIPNDRYTFGNVNKLIKAGIHFKPSQTRSLAHIKFSKRWFNYANVELPPITVDNSTRPMLLNLIAYEKSPHDTSIGWVTSYICLLDSLIDDPEDVRVLKEAGVIENSLGSDKEVAKLFNEIATDLVPNSFPYSDARYMLQRHYDRSTTSLFSKLKHEYLRTPWAFLIILALTAVQVYFTIWNPKSSCDDLCTSLKMNHRL